MSLNLLNTKQKNLYSFLDWNYIINDISLLANFEITKNRLSSPFNPKSISEINYEFDSIDFHLNNFYENETLINNSLSRFDDNEENFSTIEFIEKGRVVSLKQLNFICLQIEQYTQVFSKLKAWIKCDEYEIEHKVVQKLNSNFVKKIRVFVTDDGEVHYERHPLLKEVFYKILQIESELRNNIAKIAKSTSYEKALQFSEHDVIHDHYVLAVKSDSYNSTHGPIVAKSSSGLTLFVSPPQLKNKNNERLQLLAKVEEIMSKITFNFCDFLKNYTQELRLLQSLTLELDFLNAKAMYCHKLNLVRPKLTPNFKTSITNFFHPLIADPVANSIEINEDKKGLVISGPNTGGKTVTLKSIALCHLFVHLGIFLPATDATIHPVSNIYYFSNDQQSLTEGLSSFSSETKNYLSLLSDLGDSNLIIIDEIFNSTSSEEASALAIALLEEINNISNSKTIISTHHQVFKTFIHGSKDYISSHVGHDDKTNLPTYKLFIGEPGSSMAFKVFKNLSKDFKASTNIPDRASQILGAKQITYDKLLQDLSSKKGQLDKVIRETNQLKFDLKNKKQSMEGLIHLEKEKILKEYKKKLNQTINDAKGILDAIKSQRITTEKELYKKASSLTGRLDKSIPINTSSDEKYNIIPTTDEIRPGKVFYSTLLKKDVKIQNFNLRKKEVHVLNRKIALKCPINTLRLLPHEAKLAIEKEEIKKKESVVKINIAREVIGKLEIDGRGMRLEAFKSMVDASLIELSNGEIPFLTVIHGHGTGALKNWLRNYLKSNKDFSWESEDGNDGATKIYSH